MRSLVLPRHLLGFGCHSFDRPSAALKVFSGALHRLATDQRRRHRHEHDAYHYFFHFCSLVYRTFALQGLGYLIDMIAAPVDPQTTTSCQDSRKRSRGKSYH